MIGLGVVDENWLEEFVRPQMKKSMLHLVRMVYPSFLRHPGVFELYGADFLFDDELNLWFLEVNRSPAMQATTEEKGRIQSQLIEEVINIEAALAYNADLDQFIEESNFEWIYDGRAEGYDRYHGVIEEECM
jgi:hypothetical protein